MHISEKEYNEFVSGNASAFEQIFHNFYPSLVALAMRCSLTQEEAEDVVLEVFHRMWMKRQDIKNVASFCALINKSVRNKSINVYRNKSNQRRIISEKVIPSLNDLELRDLLVEQEIIEIVRKLIEHLPLRCKEVTLMGLAGHSSRDIADALHITESSVRTYKARSVDMLRELLDNNADLLEVFVILLIATLLDQ